MHSLNKFYIDNVESIYLLANTFLVAYVEHFQKFVMWIEVYFR